MKLLVKIQGTPVVVEGENDGEKWKRWEQRVVMFLDDEVVFASKVKHYDESNVLEPGDYVPNADLWDRHEKTGLPMFSRNLKAGLTKVTGRSG